LVTIATVTLLLSLKRDERSGVVSGVFGKAIFESGVLGTLNDLLESPQRFYRITVPHTLSQQPRVFLVDLSHSLYTHTHTHTHTHVTSHEVKSRPYSSNSNSTGSHVSDVTDT
jgi:hypothetical protein